MSRISGHLAACLGLDAGDAADLVISLGALLLGASQLDAGPSLEGIELPADIREMLESFSCDDVFRANARSIVEGIRRRDRNGGEPR